LCRYKWGLSYAQFFELYRRVRLPTCDVAIVIKQATTGTIASAIVIDKTRDV